MKTNIQKVVTRTYLFLVEPLMKGGFLFLKYCNATFIFPDGYQTELLLKGRSISFIEEQIKRYGNGWISTSKKGIATSNVDTIYVREVTIFTNYTKRDFKIINTIHSYDHSDHRNE